MKGYTIKRLGSERSVLVAYGHHAVILNMEALAQVRKLHNEIMTEAAIEGPTVKIEDFDITAGDEEGSSLHSVYVDRVLNRQSEPGPDLGQLIDGQEVVIIFERDGVATQVEAYIKSVTPYLPEPEDPVVVDEEEQTLEALSRRMDEVLRLLDPSGKH